LQRVRNGSRPPSSAASMHSSIGLRDSYKEPKVKILSLIEHFTA